MLVRNKKTEEEYEITQANYDSMTPSLKRKFVVVSAGASVRKQIIPDSEIQIIKKRTKS